MTNSIKHEHEPDAAVIVDDGLDMYLEGVYSPEHRAAVGHTLAELLIKQPQDITPEDILRLSRA